MRAPLRIGVRCAIFAADLEAQRRTIIDQIAINDAAEALKLMWRFMDLAESLYERRSLSPMELAGYLIGIIMSLDALLLSNWFHGIWGQNEFTSTTSTG